MTPYKYPKKYSPEIQSLLKNLVDEYSIEDQSVRQRQIRVWRRLKMMWENFRSQYYNDVAHNWQIPQTVDDDTTNEQGYYDKPINVLRAYLESIIAALSVTVPGIKAFPDDADNVLDLETARAADKIAKLIYRHNDVDLLWLHALFIYCTEGTVCAYNYSKDDPEYGTFVQNEYQSKLETHLIASCPNCGAELEDVLIEGDGNYPEFSSEPQVCESCGQEIIPNIAETQDEVSELWKSETKNKVRQCIEAYGGLYIKIPNWARNQADCPYLEYAYETHYVNALEKYPHLYGDIDAGMYDPYEAWGRLSPQYVGEFPINNVTCRHFWMRPSAFNRCDEQEMKKLKKLFPKGVRVDLVNNVYAGAEGDDLDDKWTITYNPMADYVHADPIGLLLVSVQEITNDLISLTLQTIEHGIGQTFADQAVLDFNAYRQTEVTPGAVYPVKAKAGRPIGEGFYEVKTATLSQEVMPFGQQIQNMGQLVSGALPSLFGGAMDEQKTASGYAMSRAQALQRLQNTWKMFRVWWKIVFSKAIPKHIEQIKEDEKQVELDTNGNFVNRFIRLSELQGKIGRIELDANEQLPMTWSQKKDTILQLMGLNNEQILMTLGAPENLPLLREAFGLDDFFIPGEDDRNKQYEEIRLLLESEPLVIPPEPMMDPTTGIPMADPSGMNPMMTPPQEEPSVPVDPDIDNHQIEFEICRHWLVSEAGRLAKIDNTPGYNNVLLHAKQHLMFIQMASMTQAPEGENGAPPKEKQKETDKEAPIKGEVDVKIS